MHFWSYLQAKCGRHGVDNRTAKLKRWAETGQRGRPARLDLAMGEK